MLKRCQNTGNYEQCVRIFQACNILLKLFSHQSGLDRNVLDPSIYLPPFIARISVMLSQERWMWLRWISPWISLHDASREPCMVPLSCVGKSLWLDFGSICQNKNFLEIIGPAPSLAKVYWSFMEHIGRYVTCKIYTWVQNVSAVRDYRHE